MIPIKELSGSVARLSTLSTESKLCFGAAGGCFVLGLMGYVFNTLIAIETTLSAFLVISAFYFILGVVSLFKGGSAIEQKQSTTISERALTHSDELDDEFVESIM